MWQDVTADAVPVSLLCCCSRDHSECTGLQEGCGTVARRPDGETHLKDHLPYTFIYLYFNLWLLSLRHPSCLISRLRVSVRVWWTWCTSSASPTPWWKSTLCPGSRRSANTKVTQGAQTGSSSSQDLTILTTINWCKFSYKAGVRLVKCHPDFRPHQDYSSPGSMCVSWYVCS